MAAIATRPKQMTRELREGVSFAFAPLAADQPRVDREKKIIYGVKMLGASSPNTHGVDEVTGTDYLYDTVQRAAPIYEGLMANVNHPPREKPNTDRDAYDRCGKYRNVHAERCDDNAILGELFGDMHLIPSHRLTESLLDAAESDELNDCFSLSHNARGQGEVRNRRYVITNIPEARSVDVVADGGSTRGLFESKEYRMKTTFGKLVLASKLSPADQRVLLEADDLMDSEMDEPTDSGWKDDLMAAVAKLVKEDDPDAHETAKKILKMLKPEVAFDGDGDEPPVDAETPESAECAKGKDAEYKKSLEESRQLFAAMVTTKLDSTLEATLIESVARIDGLSNKIKFVKGIQGLSGAKPNGTKPPPGRVNGGAAVATSLKTPPGGLNSVDDFLSVQLT